MCLEAGGSGAFVSLPTPSPNHFARLALNTSEANNVSAQVAATAHWPPVPKGGRDLNEDHEVTNGYDLARGTVSGVLIISTSTTDTRAHA